MALVRADESFESEKWEQALPRTHAIWEELAHVTPSDFPMRMFFLDKSASMKFDPFTCRALSLATQHAISPTHGSSLTFLLASPGETQVVFRRPRDASSSFTVELGSCTWYNEPIFRILDALAPAVEALNVASWSRSHGEPPIQVVCVTDGMDNMSPPHLSKLPGLVQAIKKIVGPAQNNELYRPFSDPSEKCSKDEVVGSGAVKIPVWLMWIAMGSGGEQFLKSCQPVPKEVAIIDAVIPQNLSDKKGAIELRVPPEYHVGDHVMVKPPEWILKSGAPTLMKPDSLRDAVIVHLPSDDFPLFTVLYGDDVEEVGVDVSRFSEACEYHTCWMPAGTLEAMSLVQAAMLQPDRLLRLLDSTTRTVNIWNRTSDPDVVLKQAGINLVSETHLASVFNSVRLKLAACSPPEGFLQNFMEAVGGAAGSVDADNRCVARTVMHAALKNVGQGCVVYTAHLFEEFRKAIPEQQVMIEGSVSAWLEVQCQPTLDAMSFLVKEQVLSVQEVVIDSEREGCRRCQAFVVNDSPSSMAALSAVCHFTSVDSDVLGRCFARYQHKNRSLPQAETKVQAVVQVALRKRPLHNAAIGSSRIGRSNSTSALGSTGRSNSGRSNSTSRLARYERRSIPVLWGAGENQKLISAGQAVCSGRPHFGKRSAGPSPRTP